MLKQKMMIPMLAAALVGGGLIGTGLVMAQDSTDPARSLITKIAQKFNLKEADVQTVFDADRQEHMQQMRANLDRKLTQAVTDGKISEAQKTAILNKLSEIKSPKMDPEQFKNMTQEQRHQEMEQKRAEMETWFTQNGLTPESFAQLIAPDQGFMFKVGRPGAEGSASSQN